MRRTRASTLRQAQGRLCLSGVVYPELDEGLSLSGFRTQCANVLWFDLGTRQVRHRLATRRSGIEVIPRETRIPAVGMKPQLGNFPLTRPVAIRVPAMVRY